ncbi:MAG TPA: photosynthetic reaction center cytochrome PufC [Longimicrobium sp.]|nr:photosynthetic reaction center cytochrome PufC [Longimicrobium sp.]
MIGKRSERPSAGTLAALLACTALAAVAGCDLGAKESVQVGYRGLGQEQVYDASQLAQSLIAQAPPVSLPPAGPSPNIANPWKNVQVLNDISITEFNRTMLAMTQWVAPAKNQGCAYCHNVANFASDSLYPKVVARRMLQMNRYVNNQYASHVQKTGVTCYTCHRGYPVPPAGVWYMTDENQYLRHYLDRNDLRVQSTTVANTPANKSSIKQAEYTYALMITQSRALGVNCTYCHNSRSWSTWQNAPPTRAIALYGTRMVRDLNTNYLNPLKAVFPDYRLGALGDPPKLQCITCHQGVYKPMYGAQMAKDYPALWGRTTWLEPLATDTSEAGYVDLRSADSIPTDVHSPRLGPQVVQPEPAPVPGVSPPAFIPSPATAGEPGAKAEVPGVNAAGETPVTRQQGGTDVNRTPGSTPRNVPEVGDSARRGQLRGPSNVPAVPSTTPNTAPNGAPRLPPR